jgi:RHS repeat-associated protein
VKKVVGSQTTVFAYDAAGRLVAEYGGAQPQTGGVSYLTRDTLGSTRAVTGRDGQVKSRHDYLPFGEEVDGLKVPNTGREGFTSYSHGTVRQKFTGYERDGEINLEYAQARYYSAQTGRFTSSDSFEPDLTNPQSLNKYHYCLNNPLRYIDPDGHQTQSNQNSGGLTEWFRSLIRRFMEESHPEETARKDDEEGREYNPVNNLTDGDKVVEQYMVTLGKGVEVEYHVMKATGGDFGALTLVQDLFKADSGEGSNGKVALSGVIVAANILTAGTGTGRGRSAVVIGESMEARVIPIAEELGVGYYKAKGAAEAGKLVERNLSWIVDQVRKGKSIFDIGIDVNRAERSERYIQEFQRLRSLGLERVKAGTVSVGGKSEEVYQWVPKEAVKTVNK